MCATCFVICTRTIRFSGGALSVQPCPSKHHTLALSGSCPPHLVHSLISLQPAQTPVDRPRENASVCSLAHTSSLEIIHMIHTIGKWYNFRSRLAEEEITRHDPFLEAEDNKPTHQPMPFSRQDDRPFPRLYNRPPLIRYFPSNFQPLAWKTSPERKSQKTNLRRSEPHIRVKLHAFFYFILFYFIRDCLRFRLLRTSLPFLVLFWLRVDAFRLTRSCVRTLFLQGGRFNVNSHCTWFFHSRSLFGRASTSAGDSFPGQQWTDLKKKKTHSRKEPKKRIKRDRNKVPDKKNIQTVYKLPMATLQDSGALIW